MRLLAALLFCLSSLALGDTPPARIPKADATHDGYLSSTDWSAFSAGGIGSVTSVGASVPLRVTNPTTTPALTIDQAGTASSGYLSSIDWAAFNAKQPAGSYVLTSRSVNTTAPLAGGGALSSDLTLSMPASTSVANGYLTAADWAAFNAKQPAGSYVLQATAVNTTSPLTGGGDLSTTRTLSIPAATTAFDGYLTAGDWTLFNNKAAKGVNADITSTTALTTVTGALNNPGLTILGATNNQNDALGLVLKGGNVNDSGFLLWNTAGAGVKWTIRSHSNGDFEFIDTSNGQLVAVFTPSTGRMGIGSASPGSKLTVNGDIESKTTGFKFPNGTTIAGAATGLLNGYLTSTDWALFNAKQAAGNYVTALTGDVSADGPGAAAATVSSVGGSLAADVHTAELAANAATSANTASTIVKRDGSGNFTAGTVTAALTGHASADEPAISSGTTSQYWRGDKTFQTLDSLAVAENTNLYYTNARVQTAAKNGTSGQNFYVAKDVGNDANDCSVLKPCATIGAAVTAANAVAAYLKQAVVYIAPPSGSTGYGEDVTLSQQGVNLQCGNPVQNSRACLVKGSLTVNLTGTSGGGNFVAGSNEVYVNGMVFSTATATALTFSGTTFQRLALVNSYIESTAAGGFTALSATNSGTSGGTASTLSAWDTQVNNSSASNPTISQTNGRVWFFGTQSVIQNGTAAGHSIDQSGTSSFVANITAITGEANITDNTANATFNLSTIASGSNPCVVTPSSPSTGVITLAYFGCTSTATNSVTGSGVVVPIGASTRLSSSGDIISTVTQAVLPGFPQGEQQIGAGATTGTNVLLSLKGGHVKIAQTTAPTASPSANAGTSATCSVSNAVDSAGKLSLTTGSGSWASGTQCTVTFNKAYGVAPICTFSPTGANAAANAVAQKINFPATSTTAFTVNFGAADTAGTAYTWAYHCVETQ